MKRYRNLARVLLAALTAVMIPAPLPVAAAAVFPEAIVADRDSGNISVTGNWTTDTRGSRGKVASVITVRRDFERLIILNNATVDLSGHDYTGFLTVEPGAEARVLLLGESRISGGAGAAGLTVPEGAKLTLLGEGTLRVSGGAGGAGIGGNSGMSCGKVVLGDRVEYKRHCARITATGGEDAAGIGGGAGGNGGELTVWSGLVEAQGSGAAQDVGYGAGEKAGRPGYTRFHGGRLVNYEKVGWRPDDTAPRQELKVTVVSLNYLDQAEINAIYTNADTVYTTDIPRGRNLWETEAAYLYIPTDVDRVRIHVGSGDFLNAETYYDIPDNKWLKIDLLTR